MEVGHKKPPPPPPPQYDRGLEREAKDLQQLKGKELPITGKEKWPRNWAGKCSLTAGRRMFTQATASDRKAEKKRRILNEETNALVANQPILRSTEQELNPGFRHQLDRNCNLELLSTVYCSTNIPRQEFATVVAQNETSWVHNPINDPPNDVIIVSGDKRCNYDTVARNVTQSESASNVYFGLNPNRVTVQHHFFLSLDSFNSQMCNPLPASGTQKCLETNHRITCFLMFTLCRITIVNSVDHLQCIEVSFQFYQIVI